MSSRARKVILTMRRSDAGGYLEPRDAISHDWIALVGHYGFLPILLPSTLEAPLDLAGDLGDIAAVVITNGEDVGDNRPRDRLEVELITWASSAQLPVLGFCRGCQLINVHFGGRLCRDLAARGPSHVAVEHQVALSAEFAEAAGAAAVRVNSFHNQGIVAGDLAGDLEPLAVSPDGVIEAFRHRSRAIVAVQWHPERPGAPQAISDYLFHTWIGNRD